MWSAAPKARAKPCWCAPSNRSWAKPCCERAGAPPEKNLCNGPAKLCAAFDLDRRHDGADLCDPAGAVWVAVPDHLAETTAAQGPVIVTTRIGLSRAAGAPFRFYLEASPWVSRRAKEKRAGKK